MSNVIALSLNELLDKLYFFIGEILPNYRIIYQTKSELRDNKNTCVISLIDLKKRETIYDDALKFAKIEKYEFTYSLELQGENSISDAIRCLSAVNENHDFFNYAGIYDFDYLTNSSQIFLLANQERATLLLSFFACILLREEAPYVIANKVSIDFFAEKIQEENKFFEIDLEEENTNAIN